MCVFLCLSPANPTPLCDTENGWQPFGSNCYKRRAGSRKSWAAARSDCVREGGDLVSITSAEEEQYVTSRLDASAFDLWIGFSTMVRIISVCVCVRSSLDRYTCKIIKSRHVCVVCVFCNHLPSFHRNAQLYPVKFNQMPRLLPGLMRVLPHT